MLTTQKIEIEAIEFAGCGHTSYLSADQLRERRRDHRSFYCSHCGRSNIFPGKSDLEKLRGQLSSTKDMLDTVRQDRDHTERRRRAEKAAKTRIKNRVAKGVCPCCKRTFQDLQRHMENKHPDFATAE